MSNQSPAHQLAAGLADMNEALAVIVEAAAGHRAELEARGFSPTAAEQGAMTYHNELIRTVMQGTRK